MADELRQLDEVLQDDLGESLLDDIDEPLIVEFASPILELAAAFERKTTMPGEKNLSVWKGNTFQTVLRFKINADTALDLTGSTVVFRALWAGGEIRKTGPSSDVAIPTPTNGEVTVTLTVAETRTIPNGAIAKYEIERHIGGAQTTLLFGTLVASEWVNDDV